MPLNRLWSCKGLYFLFGSLSGLLCSHPSLCPLATAPVREPTCVCAGVAEPLGIWKENSRFPKGVFKSPPVPNQKVSTSSSCLGRVLIICANEEQIERKECDPIVYSDYNDLPLKCASLFFRVSLSTKRGVGRKSQSLASRRERSRLWKMVKGQRKWDGAGKEKEKRRKKRVFCVVYGSCI